MNEHLVTEVKSNKIPTYNINNNGNSVKDLQKYCEISGFKVFNHPQLTHTDINQRNDAHI